MEVKSPASLLLACLCFEQDETTHAIQKLATPESWKAAIEQAQFHGVAQILYHKLNNKQIALELPEDLHTSLRWFYLRNIRDNLVLARQAEEILSILDETGIPVIPLKGLYLAEKAYQNIILRPMEDIDLLVPSDKVVAALDALKKAGNYPAYPINLRNDLAFLHSIPLINDSNKTTIDLHWRLFPPELPFLVDMKLLWMNARPDTVCGEKVFAMGYEETILHLSTHFIYMHRHLSRLRHAYDIAVLVQVYQEQINWKHLIHLVQQWGVGKTTFMALVLVKKLLNAPVPADVLGELQPADYQPVYLEEIIEQLMDSPNFSVNLAEFWAPRPLNQKIEFFFEKVFCPPYLLRQRYPRIVKKFGLPLAYLLRFFDVLKRQIPMAFRLIQHDPDLLIAQARAQKMEDLRRWLITD